MADISDNTVWNEVDPSNSNSGTYPGFPEGMLPSAVNDAARALMGALKRYYDRVNPTQTSTGTANAQVLTYSVAPATYVVGDTYTFQVGSGLTNTGAVTLNVNGLGATPVIVAGQSLLGGELQENTVSIVAYDSSNNFQLLNPKGRIFGNLDVTGNLTVDGDFHDAGTSSLNALTANSASIGALTATTATIGTATIDGGTATLSTATIGDLSANTAAITDLTLTGGTLNATSGTFGSLAVTGNETVGGDLAVTGNETVGGNLAVTGNETVGGNLDVTGSVSTAGLTIGGHVLNILTGDVTYYIASGGSDSTGDGSISNPWATLAHAAAVVLANTNFGGHTVNLLLEGATYTSASTAFAVGTGSWYISSLSGSAPDVVIAVTGSHQDGVHVYANAHVTIANLTIGATLGFGTVASQSGTLFISNLIYTDCSDAQMGAYDGGTVLVQSNYVIAGSADSHFFVEGGASIDASQSLLPITVTASGGPFAFSNGFALCSMVSFLRSVNGDYSGVSATGQRYHSRNNSVIDTNGEDEASYFPGDSGGDTAGGGIWV